MRNGTNLQFAFLKMRICSLRVRTFAYIGTKRSRGSVATLVQKRLQFWPKWSLTLDQSNEHENREWSLFTVTLLCHLIWLHFRRRKKHIKTTVSSQFNPFRPKFPFENFGENCDPKIGQNTSIRGSPKEISGEVIILFIIYRLVRNFDRGPSNRGFLAYFRISILTKIFEWRLHKRKRRFGIMPYSDS